MSLVGGLSYLEVPKEHILVWYHTMSTNQAGSRCPLYLFVACDCMVNRVAAAYSDGQQEAEQNDHGRDTLLCSGFVARLLTATLHV